MNAQKRLYAIHLAKLDENVGWQALASAMKRQAGQLLPVMHAMHTALVNVQGARQGFSTFAQHDRVFDAVDAALQSFEMKHCDPVLAEGGNFIDENVSPDGKRLAEHAERILVCLIASPRRLDDLNFSDLPSIAVYMAREFAKNLDKEP